MFILYITLNKESSSNTHLKFIKKSAIDKFTEAFIERDS